jgi:hypothetical protein
VSPHAATDIGDPLESGQWQMPDKKIHIPAGALPRNPGMEKSEPQRGILIVVAGGHSRERRRIRI